MHTDIVAPEKTADVISLPARRASREPEDVTRSEFLRGVFGDDAPRAWVADVRGNKSGWFGRRAGDCDVDDPSWDTADTYFSVGVLQEGAPSRMIQHWKCTRVVVVDDLMEKADANAVRAALGEPSYVLRTSFGSHQFGYILREPLRDADLQGRIMRAITIAFYGGIDPGHADAVRLVRLPRSVNSKDKRRQANAGRPQPVVLLEWHPERVFDVMDFGMALDELPGLAGGTAWAEAEHGSGSRHRATPAGLPATLEEARRLYLPRDYIFAAFDKLGRVVDLQGSQGYIEVSCPLPGGHTVQDDRTAWNPSLFLDGRTGFKCHHTSHGHDASNEEIADLLRAELDARDGAGSFDALKQAALAATFPPLTDADNDSMSAAVTTGEVQQPVKRTWRRVGKGAPIEARPARRVVSSLLIRGAVTQLGSQPNVGKSQLSVLLTCALAAERHDLFGEEAPFQRPGGSVVIGNEDDADEFARRRDACLKANGLSDADLQHEIIVNEQPGFRVVHRFSKTDPVEITPEMRGLADEIRAMRASGSEIALVVIDTQAASFSGLDENSNSDMAQAGAVLAAWARELDVAALVIHHTTKEAGKAGTISLNAMRGASSMGGSVRAAAMLVAPTPEQEESLPEDERGAWFKLLTVKASYSRFAPERWFRKTGVDLVTRADDGSMAPGESTAACLYQKFGPKLGVDTTDDDLVFRALVTICEATDKGKTLLAATRCRGNRACAVIAEALGVKTADGAKMQQSLVKRGFAEEIDEKVKGKGQSRHVLKPTDAGRDFVTDWQATKSSLTEVSDSEPLPEAAEAPDTAHAADTAATPGLFGGLEEIDFARAGVTTPEPELVRE